MLSHRDIKEYVSNLVSETRDEDVRRLFHPVTSTHVNFYEGWAPHKEVEVASRDVRLFVDRVKVEVKPFR